MTAADLLRCPDAGIRIAQVESAIHGMQIERKNLIARRKRAQASR